MKLFKIILSIIMVFSIFGISIGNASNNQLSVNLPDGTVVPLNGLSDSEKYEFMKHIQKISNQVQVEKPQSPGTMNTIKETLLDPDKMERYGKSITTVIKTVCSELSITVNDFMTTPVGLFIGGMIAYKVIGEDVGKNFIIPTAINIMQAIVVIPMWIVIMCVIFYLRKKYFDTKVIYRKQVETTNEQGKTVITYSNPEDVVSYPWINKENKTFFAVGLWIMSIVITIITIVTVLC